jgi:UDP-2,4-diacetamido-2,4,6-trideoxy-beta-L-altropyranose hydrolase
VIRVDASAAAGAGHVMRSLALAQAWQEAGGRPVFAMASGDELFGPRLAREGMGLEKIGAAAGGSADASATATLARTLGARWAVADGYWAAPDYQRALRGEGVRLAMIDDTGEQAPYEADLVVNPNLHATEAMYAGRRPGTDLLLGTRFALLRRELRGRSRSEREVPARVTRVLITLGGSDPAGATEKAMRAVARALPEAAARVLVGPANARRDAIVRLAAGLGPDVTVCEPVEDVGDLLEWAELAVSGGGSTCWELAFLGVPFATVVIADNQTAIAKSLAAAGVSVDAGWHADLAEDALGGIVARLASDVAARRRMGEAGRALVDGHGAGRVVERLA